MAEIGLIGTIVGIASAGIKLSITLYTFSETVSTAQAEIKNVARDVSLTSAVLEELGASPRQDDEAKLYSGSALRTATDVVKECEGVFNEINLVMGKAMDSASKRGIKRGKLALSALDKLKWPFLQPKMDMLRGNLERLKSTLVLMLSVLSYARDLRAEKKSSPKEDEGYQKVLLENLLLANQEATRNYEVLLKTIGHQVDDHSLGKSRSLESEAPTLTGQETISAATPIASLTKEPSSEKGLASSNIAGVAAAVQESRIESTIKACITSIENALIKFEQSDTTDHEDSPIAIHIEVQKDIIKRDEHAQGPPAPWKVVSIVRKAGPQSPQAVEKPSQPDPSSDSVTNYSGLGYDPYIPHSSNSGASHNQRTAELQAQIDETLGVMQDNLKQVMTRGERLDSLYDKTDNLAVSAQGFRRGANRIRKQMAPWYIKVWNSLPSTEEAVSSIQNALPSPAATMASFQETLRRSRLFFGVEVEAENTDTAPEADNNLPPGEYPGEYTTTEHDPEDLDDFLTPASPGHNPNSNFDSSPSAVLERTSPKPGIQPSLGEDGEGREAQDPADAVHQLLAEWTTLFDD